MRYKVRVNKKNLPKGTSIHFPFLRQSIENGESIEVDLDTAQVEVLSRTYGLELTKIKPEKTQQEEGGE